jgi:hypothetical protein
MYCQGYVVNQDSLMALWLAGSCCWMDLFVHIGLCCCLLPAGDVVCSLTSSGADDLTITAAAAPAAAERWLGQWQLWSSCVNSAAAVGLVAVSLSDPRNGRQQ